MSQSRPTPRAAGDRLPTPRRSLAYLALAVVLGGCSPDASPGPSGLVVVSSGGTALVEGADEVSPTLELGISGPGTPPTRDAEVRLDGRELPLVASAAGLAARVAPMSLGSAHQLDIKLAGRSPQRLGFRVVRPTAAMAAVHEVNGKPVVNMVFERPPDRGAVERALRPALSAWHDDQRLTAAWAGPAPGAIDLPGDIATSHGSHLAAPLHLDLAAPGPVHRVTVPGVAPGARLPVTGYSVGSAASRMSVSAHVRQLDVLAPTGWRVNADGSLSGAADASEVAAAKAAGVAVWPVVQNDSSDADGASRLLNDPDATKRLVSGVTDGAVSGGFAGIHLDLEGVAAADRDSLSRLVHDLAVSLHARSRRLAVDVIPHRSDHLNRYSAAYDERAIGRDADVVAMLAYDQHTAASSPGPVAGLDWQGQVVTGTLEGLSPSSALLGLPLYARTWEGGSSLAAAYGDAVTQALVHEGATVDYDFTEAVPSIRWQGAAGPSFTYFDDADSLARKMDLARRRGIAGVACWRLGFEDPAIWALLR